MLTWLGMITETFLSALQRDLPSWWEKRTKKSFGQLYSPVRNSLTPNPAVGRGKKKSPKASMNLSFCLN